MNKFYLKRCHISLIWMSWSFSCCPNKFTCWMLSNLGKLRISRRCCKTATCFWSIWRQNWVHKNGLDPRFLSFRQTAIVLLRSLKVSFFKILQINSFGSVTKYSPFIILIPPHIHYHTIALLFFSDSCLFWFVLLIFKIKKQTGK